MKIGEILFYSPKCRFIDLDFTNKEVIINCFENRILSYYLHPAHLLNNQGYAFSSGLISVSAIDILSRLDTGKEIVDNKDFILWVQKNIQGFSENLAKKFYSDFRCGLVHEGRIKNCGQFSYEIGSTIIQQNNVIIINPKLLLDQIAEALAKYVKKLETIDSIFKTFKESLKRDFAEDVKLSKELMK